MDRTDRQVDRAADRSSSDFRERRVLANKHRRIVCSRVGGSALGVVFTFYLLFYFLRDRRLALETLRTLSPLSQVEMDRLFTQIVDTVHATIYGTVVVAGVQGTLGGLMFWWLWSADATALGPRHGPPRRGAGLGRVHRLDPSINFPGTRRQLGEGHYPRYPMLVGNRLKLHTVPAFISLVARACSSVGRAAPLSTFRLRDPCSPNFEKHHGRRDRHRPKDNTGWAKDCQTAGAD
jgi:hypothetical protein